MGFGYFKKLWHCAGVEVSWLTAMRTLFPGSPWQLIGRQGLKAKSGWVQNLAEMNINQFWLHSKLSPGISENLCWQTRKTISCKSKKTNLCWFDLRPCANKRAILKLAWMQICAGMIEELCRYELKPVLAPVQTLLWHDYSYLLAWYTLAWCTPLLIQVKTCAYREKNRVDSSTKCLLIYHFKITLTWIQTWCI